MFYPAPSKCHPALVGFINSRRALQAPPLTWLPRTTGIATIHSLYPVTIVTSSSPAINLHLLHLLRWRRDVRRFRPEPLPPSLLPELVDAANLVPSVELRQPWRFVAVDDPGRRAGVRGVFERYNREALEAEASCRAARYARLKLAGLDDLCWLRGGYPELHAGRLAGNARFLAGLRAFAEMRPVHGECGGYMVLGRALVDAGGVAHAMAGLLPVECSFAARRLHLGYRRARWRGGVPFAGAGEESLGHEYHHATITAGADATLADMTNGTGKPLPAAGHRVGNVTGTFFHVIAPAPPG